MMRRKHQLGSPTGLKQLLFLSSGKWNNPKETVTVPYIQPVKGRPAKTFVVSFSELFSLNCNSN